MTLANDIITRFLKNFLNVPDFWANASIHGDTNLSCENSDDNRNLEDGNREIRFSASHIAGGECSVSKLRSTIFLFFNLFRSVLISHSIITSVTMQCTNLLDFSFLCFSCFVLPYVAFWIYSMRLPFLLTESLRGLLGAFSIAYYWQVDGWFVNLWWFLIELLQVGYMF